MVVLLNVCKKNEPDTTMKWIEAETIKSVIKVLLMTNYFGLSRTFDLEPTTCSLALQGLWGTPFYPKPRYVKQFLTK